MRTPLVQPAAPPPSSSPAEFIATFALILAAIAGLLVFDTALAKVDVKGRKAFATRQFTTGERLIAQGKIEEGIERIRAATTLDDENTGYGVALAQATLEAGRPDAAEQILLPLLERNPNEGAANLAMARVLAKEGKLDQAKSYYRRAIYGTWPGGVLENRTAARFELIDLLARTNAKEELLAELLPIQDDSTNDSAKRKRIARLFVVAGSPSRAIAIYRDLLSRDERDADSYVGLADAALSIGDFTTARVDLLAAQKLSPEDSVRLQDRLILTDSVIALDPTQRGLSIDEQARRTRNLVQMTMASVRSCLRSDAPELAAGLDSASALLREGQGQSIQQSLLLAEHLWGVRRTNCSPQGPEGALALVQNRIAR